MGVHRGEPILSKHALKCLSFPKWSVRKERVSHALRLMWEVLGGLGLECGCEETFWGTGQRLMQDGASHLLCAPPRQQERGRRDGMGVSSQGLHWGPGRQEADRQGWCQAASARAERPHCWC